MNITVRAYTPADVEQMLHIWNEIVEEGRAFPFEEAVKESEAAEFFAANTYAAVACDEESGTICGVYVLHPNNVGRCAHIANASYAVTSKKRGLHIGEAMVKDCIAQAKRCGFKLLQFNNVVASNLHAHHLYERLGFVRLGTIPGGFRNKDGAYEDIIPYYIAL